MEGASAEAGDPLLVEIDGAVATVTFNRPEALNALSIELRARLAEAMAALDEDPAVRVVILTGAGDKAFSAGLDIKELASDPDAVNDAVGKDPCTNPSLVLERFGKPLIGAINGLALTGGLEIALLCDMLVAADHARFADTHARVGLIPGWGATKRLSRLIGVARAKEMSLTGNFIDAVQAERWGLVNHVVPAAELLPLARKLAADVASGDPQFVATYRALIDEGHDKGLAAALDAERAASRRYNAGVTTQEFAATSGAARDRARKQ